LNDTFHRFLLTALFVFAYAVSVSAREKSLGDIELNAQAYVQSAYHSRGKISEDRPIEANLVTAMMNLDFAGELGLWHWQYHSLTPRCRYRADRMFRESDWAIYYRNSYGIAEDWSRKSEYQQRWFTYPFLHSEYRGDCHRVDTEIWGRLTLDNPYLVPSGTIRRGLHRKDYTYFKVGLHRQFEIFEDLSFTPGAYMELADQKTFVQRYGKREGGGNYRTGPQALNIVLRFDYRLTDWLKLYASVTQFDIVSSQARHNTSGFGPVAKRDIAYFTVGVSVTY
jgi:hypothetical protein